mmetsp:Transcript_25758/g.47073  ORF Transcript_25758/g.47073 Transcript_25758/m.47073 type:complete len:349 (-) Transcript_25758:12-1058(-)
MQFGWPYPGNRQSRAPFGDTNVPYGTAYTPPPYGVYGYSPQDAQTKQQKRSSFLAVFIAGILSFFCFMASYSFWLLRYAVGLITLTCVAAIAFIGMTMPWKRNRPLHKPIGTIAFIGLLLGVLLGSWNFDVNGYYALMYTGSRVYSDVEADQLAGTVRDAGRLDFTDDAQLDTASAIGYAADDGTKYCVVPITTGGLSGSNSSTSSSNATSAGSVAVQFWAVGVGCCSWRGAFDCGAASDSTAHSGIVQFASLGLFNRTNPAYEGFDAARLKAEGLLGLIKVKRPIYVRWATQSDLDLRDWLELFLTWIVIGVLTVLFAAASFPCVRQMLEAEAKRMDAESSGLTYID